MLNGEPVETVLSIVFLIVDYVIKRLNLAITVML